MNALLLRALLLTALPSLELPAETPLAPISEHTWVASIQALSLLSRGLELQGEHYFARGRWSVAVALGARPTAGGDARGFHLSTGAELRLWLWQPGRWSTLETRKRGGLFALVRVDAAYDQLRTRSGTLLGEGFQLEPGLGLGWRLLPGGHHVEVTPWVAFAAAETFPLHAGDEVAPKATVEGGVTVGWLF